MRYTDLEDEIFEAIRRCCQTDEDKEAAKTYFKGSIVNDLIDEALEE